MNAKTTSMVYDAQVLSFITSDTLELQLDLGFDMNRIITAKLARIREHESKDVQDRAKEAIMSFYKQSRKFKAVVYKVREGRYLVDLVADGVRVNKELLDSGLVRPFKYFKKERPSANRRSEAAPVTAGKPATDSAAEKA